MTFNNHPPLPPARFARGFAVSMWLLLIRGVLLWVVVPASFAVWLVLWPLMRVRRISAGQLVGWADLNLIALIEHTLLRPFVQRPLPWTAPRALPDVTHRVGFLDPA